MIGVVWRLILGGLWRPILAVLTPLAAYFKGRSDAAAKARTDGMRDDLKTHERINDADIGTGADDGANRNWLRDFADRNRRR